MIFIGTDHFLIFIYLFIWLGRVLVAACRIFRCSTRALRCGTQASLVAVCRLLSSCGVWAPERAGSVVVARGLSCPAACGILVPRPGIDPASLALEGGFLTTGQPVKSLVLIF